MADLIADAVQKCQTQHHDRLGDALACLALITPSPGKTHHIEVRTKQRCDVESQFCNTVDTYVVAGGPGPICPSLQFSAKQASRPACQDSYIIVGPMPNLAHPLLDAQACRAFLQRTTSESWRVCSSRAQDGAYVHTVESASASFDTPCELSCKVLLDVTGEATKYFSGLACHGKNPHKFPSGSNYNW